MNIIQVADPRNYHPFPVAPFVAEAIGSGLPVDDWVRKHMEEWQAGDIFVIDANFSLLGREAECFGGIKVLKMLRLLGCRQHCVLYSVYSLSQILAESKFNMIVCSAGTTYVRQTETIDESFCAQRLHRLSEENPIQFMHGEAIEWLSTERHSLANWWGVLRAYEVLDFCRLTGGKTSNDIRNVLRKDRSYTGLLMNLERFQSPRPVFNIPSELGKAFAVRVRNIWKKNLKSILTIRLVKAGHMCCRPCCTVASVRIFFLSLYCRPTMSI